ncbi:MAG: RidA family protein [Bacteroidota bacterium]
MHRLALLALLGATAFPAQAQDRPYVEFLNTEAALAADLPFSQAVRVGDLVFLSGALGTVPGTVGLAPGGIEAESRQTMENIATTLEAFGLGMEDVVKCTVMLVDIAEWPAFNAVYRTFFEPPFPARSAFAASGLALGARVEVECIAAVPEAASE